MERNEAREALAGIGASQARLAQAIGCPPWRHAAFGAIMGSFVGAMALPTGAQISMTTLALLATGALAAHDRRRMGVFVNGYRKGATRGVTVALLGAMLVLMFAELHLRFEGGAAMSKLAIAVVAAALATWASVVWQRVYVRELTGGTR